MRRRWAALAVGIPLVIAVAIPVLRRSRRIEVEAPPVDAPAMAKVRRPAVEVAPPPAPPLAGLDLGKIDLKEHIATAPLADKKLARLAIDPALQRVAEGLMAMYRLPEAAVVMMDVETGKIIAYASHVEKGPKRDLAIEASAPAASVFKVITATSLVEHAKAAPDDKQCYSGGEQRITAADLVRDPKRDRWCTTVAGAMGRSINTVFARLALENLKPAELEETAHTLGFGAPLPFDVPVQASALHVPDDSLAFARTAAGFWNSTLSPLHAAWLGAAIARGGEPVRPVLVADVIDDGKVTWSAPMGHAQRRIMSEETSRAVTTMMDMTVTDGTSFKAFHDSRARTFLPGVSVAGKTGTLTDPNSQRFYTWFAGFAPSKPIVLPPDADQDGHAPPRKVAFGVLVVNEPKWTIKANVLAREVLRAYFAGQSVPGVTPPHVAERTEHPPDHPRAGGASATSTTPATKQRRQRGS